MNQEGVDARVQAYYAHEFVESERLTTRSAQGRLEFQRVQELVQDLIEPESHILDVGGATGIHAAELARQGHAVTLIDPVPEQVQIALAHGTFDAKIGDARHLEFDEDSFDAVLLFGPLYHLIERDIRLSALREAHRVTRRGGLVFAAAIPRFIAFAALSLGRVPSHPYPAEWVDLLENGSASIDVRFPGAHYHTAEELEQELKDAGFVDVRVCAIEGPGGMLLEEIDEADEDVFSAALSLARRTGEIPGLRDISNHIMGIGRVP